MSTVSVCMIVKDEERNLAGCLEGVRPFADEIVVVDTGSTDATERIARAYTDKVYSLPFSGDFAAARNASFSYGTCDYLLAVDADERFAPQEADKLAELKGHLSADVVYLRWRRPEFQTVAYQPRMVRRSQGPYWHGRVHERLVMAGEVLFADVEFYHAKEGDPDYGRNVRIARELPDEELRGDFWLCAHCWFDALLAGDRAMEQRCYRLMVDNVQPYGDKKPTIDLLSCALIAQEHKRDALRLAQLPVWWLKRARLERRASEGSEHERDHQGIDGRWL